MSSYRHWKLERDTSDPNAGVVWAILDTADSSTNTLGAEVMVELRLILDELEKDRPKGLIFKSAKEAGFIAGANIEEFTSADTPEKARLIIKRGWDIYNQLAAVKYPTLALVRGHCMGGGTELALACRYRIAVDEPGTKFALPEVMLGIVPGWGGMLRLPQIVGPAAAMDMMLTGKNIDARAREENGPGRRMRAAAGHGQRRPHAGAVRQAAAPGATAFDAETDERPAQGHGGERREEAGGEARAPGTLPGALRHHRPVAELRRQHARGTGRRTDVARRAGQASDHAQPDPRLLSAGPAQGFRQGRTGLRTAPRARGRRRRHGRRRRRLVRAARHDRDAAGPDHRAHRPGRRPCREVPRERSCATRSSPALRSTA
jgi:enoyl-CoA hydratase/carnithine racemase